MPNVYISLGVHDFFRDAPTTLYGERFYSTVSSIDATKDIES